MLRRVLATRYVTPLREGGSMPALVEASDDGMYVVKFRGAGQGPRVLVAELLAGEVARRLGLRVPELVLVDIDAALARNEPDYEIRALTNKSVGLNLGLDYLPGSLAWDPAAEPAISPEFASRVVWLDAYVANIDRTARNTNMLTWHGDTWLIDHGAAFYFQYAQSDFRAAAQSPFAAVRQHVLLRHASRLAETDADARHLLDATFLAGIAAAIPGEWLDKPAESHAAQRQAFTEYLVERLATSSRFVEEAERARTDLV